MAGPKPDFALLAVPLALTRIIERLRQQRRQYAAPEAPAGSTA